MKHVKLVVLMLLVVALVASTVFAGSASSKKATTSSMRMSEDDLRLGKVGTSKYAADPIEASQSENARIEKGSSQIVPLSIPTSPVTVSDVCSGFGNPIHIGAGKTFTTVSAFMAMLNGGAPINCALV